MTTIEPISPTVRKYKILLYIRNIAVSIDQFVNTVFGGDPDETMSSRCGKAIRRAKTPRKFTIAYWLNKFLDIFQKEHTIKNIEEDEGGEQVL